MRHARFAVFAAQILFLAGCTVTSRFEAVDGDTNRPLAGVEVTRYEWREWTSLDRAASRPPPPLLEVRLGATEADGKMTSGAARRRSKAENNHGFTFAKLGYSPAEVRIGEDDKARVGSPSDGGRWIRRETKLFGHWYWQPSGDDGILPPAYLRSVPADAVIRVPMWPLGRWISASPAFEAR